jgi:hypothetical protein
LYLWLDKEQKSKRDARMSTSQREQYGGTVQLFIGMGRNLVKITFMTLITSYNHDTNYHGLIGLFFFKSVQPFVIRRTIMPNLLGQQLHVYLRAVLDYMLIFRRYFFLKDLRRRSRPPTGTLVTLTFSLALVPRRSHASILGLI